MSKELWSSGKYLQWNLSESSALSTKGFKEVGKGPFWDVTMQGLQWGPNTIAGILSWNSERKK